LKADYCQTLKSGELGKMSEAGLLNVKNVCFFLSFAKNKLNVLTSTTD